MSDLLNIAKQFLPLLPRGAPPGLPIYCWKKPSCSVFYTPGLVAVVNRERMDDLEQALLGNSAASGKIAALASRIEMQARQALHLYERFYRSRYRPECLTLSVQDHCPLSCVYCLRTGHGHRTLNPVDAAIGTAIVAGNCRRKNIRMPVVFHGWGEPAGDFPLLKALVNTVNTEARRVGVVPFRYIATSGVLSAKLARYLAKSFDLVGISCDGPPEIQDHQRKLQGLGTSRIVEQTASTLRQSGTPISVRATITRESMKRQEEIARYLLEVIQPVEIHFEPVYRSPGEFADVDPEEFYEHFQKAQLFSARQNVPLTLSGSRISEIHGPYCHIFRNVLHLVPGGQATTCFAAASPTEEACIATMRAGTLAIDMARVRKLRASLSRMPHKCRNCLNGFHCAGPCPDLCRLNPGQRNPRETFRCGLQLAATVSQILKTAREIEPDAHSSGLAWRAIGAPIASTPFYTIPKVGGRL